MNINTTSAPTRIILSSSIVKNQLTNSTMKISAAIATAALAAGATAFDKYLRTSFLPSLHIYRA